MLKIRKLLTSVRVVFRKSTALTKIVVASAVILSIAALLTLHGAINAAQQNTENMRSQAIALEQENNRLKQYLADMDTVEGVIQIARDKLGLVQPDSIVIQPE